jgi:hypothetical protein
MLTDNLRGALTRRNILLREHQRANEAHRAATWIRARDRAPPPTTFPPTTIWVCKSVGLTLPSIVNWPTNNASAI